MNASPDLAAFIEEVAGECELQRVLADEKSTDGFALACAALAAKRSLRVTADEVRAVLQERTLIWMQRHTL